MKIDYSISRNFSNNNFIHSITQANDKKAIKPLISALLSRIENEVSSIFNPKVTINLAQAFHQHCDDKNKSILLLKRALKDIKQEHPIVNV